MSSTLDFIAGFLAPWAIYAVILLLHLILPARRVAGYVKDATGSPLQYRLNGPLVLVLTVGIWFGAGFSGVMPWDWLWTHAISGAAGACVMGLAYSLAMVLSAPKGDKPLGLELFLGRKDNPRHFGGRVDAKMFLYLVGAAMLALNLLAATAHHLISQPSGGVNPGMVLHCALFMWFVCEYLVFEEVHLYTYDLFAEKVGFKLGWGCLVFYPYFYPVGVWATAGLGNPGTGTPFLVMCGILFFGGWVLSRGANLQKFRFKTRPGEAFLGIQVRTVQDGQKALLCSGFWGLSRHINYLGEILMSLGLTLALGWPLALAGWLYPLYYVALLFTRERDDDRRCASKYGKLWEDYRAAVPRRIIPWIY